MRAVLVGAGSMGKAWGKNLVDSPDADMVAWVDIQPGAAEQAVQAVGAPETKAYTDLDTAVREHQPDFVVDVTPPDVHCEMTIRALGLGLPVLGEKPMATTIEEAKRMVAAADDAGKLYMVSQSRRYHGGAQAYRDHIANYLGTLGILNADFYIGAHFGGFRDEMDSPLILDMAIHTFDMARMLTGCDAVSVYAEEFNPAWSWYRGDAAAQCLFEMENGIRFNYRGCWCSEGKPTSWDTDWRAIGERGTATWDGFDRIEADLVKATGTFISETEVTATKPYTIAEHIAGSLADFCTALRTGKPPKHGECHDNIKSFAMVIASSLSAREGRKVNLQEILG